MRAPLDQPTGTSRDVEWRKSNTPPACTFTGDQSTGGNTTGKKQVPNYMLLSPHAGAEKSRSQRNRHGCR
ncbi:hypothetical protein NDU88_005140 [Pleurodeles waltl]|uniref:Uncharacterized protein n=1 Tax=Pleurodeles waltl TaxID=8319 RepID=A0AAV7VKM6_PLEWA|nr:hypothetical protein NDU88_005140 [Pleurodeles waltl]